MRYSDVALTLVRPHVPAWARYAARCTTIFAVGVKINLILPFFILETYLSCADGL